MASSRNRVRLAWCCDLGRDCQSTDYVPASWKTAGLCSNQLGDQPYYEPSILVIFGPSMLGVSTPMGSFNVGKLSYSTYRVFLAFFAVALLIALWALFKHTKFGLHSRATMQNPEIAYALGVDSNKMYLLTYMLGSALAGLCGGLYAPTMSIVPTIGNSFMVQSFVTVVVGGSEPILGTLFSGTGLGIVNSVLHAFTKIWHTDWKNRYVARCNCLYPRPA